MKFYCLFLIIFLPLNVIGQTIYNTDSGLVKFNSYAALEIIKASSNKLTGILDAGKKTFAFDVNINSFQGFNGSLQREHFNENYLETNKFPTATFAGKIIEEIDFTVAGKYNIRAKGTLNIHGVRQERIIKCVITINHDAILVESEFTVLLNDHDIKVPKVVHEKIASEIQVTVKTELKKKNN
ncbi:MAG: YceI family protein [Bacteroidia bacterium]